MDGKMKTCVAFYVVFLLTLCECKNSVTSHEYGDDFINPKLIQQLFENLESKSDVIEKLISRVDRLESRERELHKQNDALSKKVEELEIRDLKQEKEIEYLQAQMQTQHANVDTLLKTITPVASGKEFDNDVQNDTASPKTKRQMTGSNYEGNHVAFFAGITAHLQHQGKAQPIAFDKVITNVGNAYNAHVGDFRAPVAGTYVFSVTLMAYQSHTTYYYFAKNGNAVSWLYVRGQESPYAVSSQTAVLELDQGDDVSIRNYDADESLHGDLYSTLSGFLLREKFPISVIG